MAGINERVVGRCSICGGEVVIPTVFWSVVQPIPTCKSCGAVMRNQGPVIPMVPIAAPKKNRWDYRDYRSVRELIS